jgi:cystathionine gamma-synthase/cystathionine gamma-lyase/cystathionine beta-lyase
MPVFQSAMFEYARETNYHDLKRIRLNNTPNHVGLYENLAALEVAEATLVASSEMAALSTALLSVPTKEVISDRVCYLGAANHLLSAPEDCCTLNSKLLEV